MTVKELISKLRGNGYLVELREDNFFLCKTYTDNKTLELFYDREIIDWFPDSKGGCGTGSLVINIKGEDGE